VVRGSPCQSIISDDSLSHYTLCRIETIRFVEGSLYNLSIIHEPIVTADPAVLTASGHDHRRAVLKESCRGSPPETSAILRISSRGSAHPPVAEESAIVTITTRWNALAETDAGPHGGVAACGDVVISASLSALPTAHLTQCAWQTEHTYGELSVPLSKSGPVTTDGLANNMRRLRADLETPV
jgi:hypothetical protein